MAGRPQRRLRDAMRDEDGCEPRERKWIDRMLTHGDSRRAHREAFGEEYKSKAYMRYPHVVETLKRDIETRRKRYELSDRAIIQELMYIVKQDLRAYYNEDGSVKAIQDLDEAAAAAIHGIEVEEYDTFGGRGEDREVIGTTRTFKYKRYSKTEALALLSKFKIMAEHIAPTRAELTGKDGGPLVAPPVITVKFGDKD